MGKFFKATGASKRWPNSLWLTLPSLVSWLFWTFNTSGQIRSAWGRGRGRGMPTALTSRWRWWWWWWWRWCWQVTWEKWRHSSGDVLGEHLKGPGASSEVSFMSPHQTLVHLVVKVATLTCKREGEGGERSVKVYISFYITSIGENGLKYYNLESILWQLSKKNFKSYWWLL